MYILFHRLALKSKIDKRTETCCVEGTKTEQKKKHTDQPFGKMLLGGEIGIKDDALQLFAEGEQNEESEEQCYYKRNIEMRTLYGYN